MVFGMLRRGIDRRGLHSPDENRIHHRLIELGYGPDGTVYCSGLETAAVTALAIVVLETGVAHSIGVALVSLLLLVHLVFFSFDGSDRPRGVCGGLSRLRPRTESSGPAFRGHSAVDRALA